MISFYKMTVQQRICSVLQSFHIHLFEMVIASVYALLGFFLLILTIREFVDGAEIQLQQVELKSPPHLEGVYDIPLMRVTKFNRTDYVLNCNVETKVDTGDEYSVPISLLRRANPSGFLK